MSHRAARASLACAVSCRPRAPFRYQPAAADTTCCRRCSAPPRCPRAAFVANALPIASPHKEWSRTRLELHPAPSAQRTPKDHAWDSPRFKPTQMHAKRTSAASRPTCTPTARGTQPETSPSPRSGGARRARAGAVGGRGRCAHLRGGLSLPSRHRCTHLSGRFTVCFRALWRHLRLSAVRYLETDIVSSLGCQA